MMSGTADGRLFDVPATGPERRTYALNLVGAGDVARALGLTNERIRQLAPTMPEPVGCIHRGTDRELAVWAWDDVRSWAEAAGRPIVCVPP